MSDESLRDFRERAAAADILKVAERLRARLERAGESDNWTGACPRCGETGGFTIDARKRAFSCRLSSTGGDVIAMVRHALALRSNIEAAQWFNEPPQAGER